MEINLEVLARMVDSVLGPQIGGFVFAALLFLGLLSFLIWSCRYIYRAGVLGVFSFLKRDKFSANWQYVLITVFFFLSFALAAQLFITEIRSREALQQLTEEKTSQREQLQEQIELQLKQIEEYKFLLKGTVPEPSFIDELIDRIFEKREQPEKPNQSP